MIIIGNKDRAIGLRANQSGIYPYQRSIADLVLKKGIMISSTNIWRIYKNEGVL